MKNRLCSFLTAAAFMVVLFGQFTGCSITGLVVGGLSDLGKSSTRTVTGWTIESVKPGTEISLMARDGSVRRGVFLGNDIVDPRAICRALSALVRAGSGARLFTGSRRDPDRVDDTRDNGNH